MTAPNTPTPELETVAYRWQLDTWPGDDWRLSELSQLECHSGAFGQPIQEELVRRSEAAATIASLTAERDRYKFNADELRKSRKRQAERYYRIISEHVERAEAAEKRVKELEELLRTCEENEYV